MGGSYDFLIISFLVLILSFMLITRHYDDKLRKKRVGLKKKNLRRLLAIKQYFLILLVCIAITACIMFLFKLAFWE